MNVKKLIASQPPETIDTILLDKFRNKPDNCDDRELAVHHGDSYGIRGHAGRKGS